MTLNPLPRTPTIPTLLLAAGLVLASTQTSELVCDVWSVEPGEAVREGC